MAENSTESKFSIFWNKTVELFGSFGHLIALALIIIEFGKTNGTLTFWGIVIILVLALIANSFLFFSNRKTKKLLQDTLDRHEKEINDLNKSLAKAERYKKAYSQINNVFRDIHIALWENSNSCPLALTSFCNNLAHTFNDITGASCYVAIKMIEDDVKNPHGNIKDMKIVTIARDDVSATERKRKRRKLDHFIWENHDFNQIISKVRTGRNPQYFFSNDLVNELYYSNSSLKCFGMRHDEFSPSTPIEEKKRRWELEYSSTIVVPINTGQSASTPGQDFYGFLCIHSKTENIFDETIDAQILSGCADGLINILKKCYSEGNSLKPIL